MQDSVKFGWKTTEPEHDWKVMVENIQDHIGSLNWGYRQALTDKGVKYLNGLATFTDPHTLKVGGYWTPLLRNSRIK